MDLLALVLILLAAAAVIAIASGNWREWIRQEWKLIRARQWGPGTDHMPGSDAVDKKKSKKLAEKQRALAKRMKKKGRHLYSGKSYLPALTSPVTTETVSRPPKADRVVIPIRQEPFKRKA